MDDVLITGTGLEVLDVDADENTVLVGVTSIFGGLNP